MEDRGALGAPLSFRRFAAERSRSPVLPRSRYRGVRNQPSDAWFRDHGIVTLTPWTHRCPSAKSAEPSARCCPGFTRAPVGSCVGRSTGAVTRRPRCSPRGCYRGASPTCCRLRRLLLLRVHATSERTARRRDRAAGAERRRCARAPGLEGRAVPVVGSPQGSALTRGREGTAMSNNNAGAAAGGGRSTAWASSARGCTSGSRPTRSGSTCSCSSRDCSGQPSWSTRCSPPSTDRSGHNRIRYDSSFTLRPTDGIANIPQASVPSPVPGLPGVRAFKDTVRHCDPTKPPGPYHGHRDPDPERQRGWIHADRGGVREVT